MKKRIARNILIGIFGCFCILCILFFFSPVGPLTVIGFEKMLVKRNIDNPYVNGNFSEWQTISLEEIKDFRIPKGWKISEDDGLYLLVDELGQTWAYGTLYGSDEDRYVNYKEFIGDLIKQQPTEIVFEAIPQFIMMDGSDIDKIEAVFDEKVSESFFCIQFFVDSQTEFVWIIFMDLSSDANQYDIAEAIVYSYAF